MSVYLRLATTEDIDMIYEWANDPVTRANSFNTAPIEYDTHVRWFNSVLANPERTLLVCMDDETPVGQTRLDLEDEGTKIEISCTIAPGYRGQGYSSKMVGQMLKYIYEHEEQFGQVQIIFAQVKPDNISSQQMLVSNGFARAEFEGENLTFVIAGPGQPG